MVLNFRTAAARDAGALRELIEAAYREPDSAGSWSSEADLLTGPRTSLEEVERLIADAASCFVLAERAGVLLGCALIQDKAPGLAYFGMFAIAPVAQEQGVGKALLSEAAIRARALWGARRMELTVINLREGLIRYYERRGFVQTGVTEPFPFHPQSGAKRTDFHLVLLRKPI